MTLLEINGTDYTPWIVTPSWSVSSEPVYEEWTDGNAVKHRDVVRRRVVGSFDFRFTDAMYATFLATLEAIHTLNNSYPLTVYIDNEKRSRSIDAFVSFSPSMVRTAGGPIYTDTFTVSIEER